MRHTMPMLACCHTLHARQFVAQAKDSEFRMASTCPQPRIRRASGHAAVASATVQAQEPEHHGQQILGVHQLWSEHLGSGCKERGRELRLDHYIDTI